MRGPGCGTAAGAASGVELSERRGDARDRLLPVAETSLTEDAHGRIPRRAVCRQAPSPAGVETVEHPCRLAHRAGDVRDRRIRRDHEIELGDDRRGIAEVENVGSEIGGPPEELALRLDPA